MRYSIFLVALAAASAGPSAPGPPVDWPRVGNDPGAMRYSVLKQINRANVKQLAVAWSYHTGDMDARAKTTLECTPIVVGGVMYVTTVRGSVVALDAETGSERWRYAPPRSHYQAAAIASGGVNRGVAYWSDGGGRRRILLGTADGLLISLDAQSGVPDPEFGMNGVVEMRDGLEKPDQVYYGMTSAPVVYENLVICGYSVTEGPRPGAPGDVRAFDVRTGREVWRFHTVPRPGEVGHETWPADGWQERSGVNAWGGLTVDAGRGIVFAGLGSAAYDYYGADRKGDNLFANCSVALDARTGKRRWHFQTLRHDIWDFDLPYPPVLVRVRHDGKMVDAAAQVTKSGFCFLFDRLTGKPLFGVMDRPVPASDVPGEQAAATQPFPLKPPPFARQGVTEADITDLSPEAHADALARFRLLRAEGPFTPGSLKGTLCSPSWHGGATWSGAAFDPETGLLYLNANNVPFVVTLKQQPEGHEPPYALTGTQKTPGRTERFHNQFHFNDQQGYPAVKPPWGTLNAIDLNRGDFAWRVPLGDYPELTAKGIPPTGTENFGGCIVTAGGLVFIGGAMDERFHAYDKATGKLLWQQALPAGGYATPCTYMVNGRQFVVIAAGGGGKLATKSGDEFVAFALPLGKDEG
jgi:quinoprotein glucose dehydrogenase